MSSFGPLRTLDTKHCAGADIGLGKTLYGKVKYVYTNYKDARYSGSDFNVWADGNRHQAVVGLGLRF